MDSTMGHGKSLQLFCTRTDILTALAVVEAQEKLIYLGAGMFETDDVGLIRSASEISTFGASCYGDSAKDATYLIFRAGTIPIPRSVPQKIGGIMYAFDQAMNPKSIMLKPGGIYQNDCVIAGQLGTVSDAPESLSLYHTLARAIRSSFRNIRSNWVGREAEQMWQNGARLTIGIHAPRTLDLAMK